MATGIGVRAWWPTHQAGAVCHAKQAAWKQIWLSTYSVCLPVESELIMTITINGLALSDLVPIALQASASFATVLSSQFGMLVNSVGGETELDLTTYQFTGIATCY